MARKLSHSAKARRWAVMLAAGVPALCVGGAPFWVGAVVAALVAVALLGSGRHSAVVSPAALALVAVGVLCLVQVAPGSMVLAPRLGRLVGAVAPQWNRISVLPGETLLRAARLLVLAGLVLAAGRVGWRPVARSIVVSSCLVALIGYAMFAVGVDDLFGIYEPVDRSLTGTRRGIATTFVNPNHQTTFMILGMASSAALLVDERGDSRDRWSPPPQLLLVALAIQAGIVLLSESRGGWVCAAALATLIGSDWALKTKRQARSLCLIAAVVAAIAAVVIAWATGLEAMQEKFVSVELAVKLYGDAPLTGFGRGTFGELSPLVRTDHTLIRHVYVESGAVGLIAETGIVGVLCLGVLGYVALRGHAKARSRSQRLLWIGLVVCGIHSLIEFSFELLGVSAAAAALLGSLDQRTWAVSTLKQRIAGGLAVVLGAITIFAGSRSRVGFERHRAEFLEPNWRPLSGQRALSLAREACSDGSENCIARAQSASRVAPFSVENWLMLSLAQKRGGAPDASRRSLHEALAWLSTPTGPQFADYVCAWWTPAELAAAFPDEADVYRFVQASLLESSPRHLAAVSEARATLHPQDPRPVENLARVALATSRPAAALEHVESLLELEPERVENWTLAVAIERARGGGELAARNRLTSALDHITEPTDRANLQSALVVSLLADPADPVRAREVARELVRSANTEAKRRKYGELEARASVALRRARDD